MEYWVFDFTTEDVHDDWALISIDELSF